MTESESLFERFCSEQGLVYERIEECDESRPDYRVTLHACDLVVEVKQIDPTAKERDLLAMPFEEWGEDHAYHWGMPGERIRSKVKLAVRQLRTLSTARTPTLLVLYDTIKHWPELLDADAMKVAMYGIETILASAEADPTMGGAKILARWHGPRRRLTRDQNTTLSAVAIMSQSSGRLSLSIYHNYFAAIQLQTSHLYDPAIQHFRIKSSPENGFPEWILA